MPIYDVKCIHCEDIFEVICTHDQAQWLKCKSCGFKLEIIPSKPATFIIEGACAANGYESQDNIPDDHYDPRVGPTSWDK